MRVSRPSGKKRSDFAYQAVYRYLVSLINTADPQVRVKLPSLRLLAGRLNVSISTIQYAYSLLEKEGRIYSVAKSGYYALPVNGGPLCNGAQDVLERLYVYSRRPRMVLLCCDEPGALLPLDGPLRMLERELARQYPRRSLSYFQPFGEPELRTALAVRYTSSPQRYWHAEDVYIGADLRSVLEILVAALALEGSTVVVESPCDWVLLRLLKAGGVRVIEWPLNADGHRELSVLKQILDREPVRLLLMSSTAGMAQWVMPTLEARRQLAELLHQHEVWLLENDCLGELCHQQPVVRLRELVNPDRLLVFSSLEKVMGSEAPFGYLLSRHFRAELQRHFLLRAFRLSPTRQKAIARLYRSGQVDQHLAQLRQVLRERMNVMTRWLEAHLDACLELHVSQVGATIWLCLAEQVDVRQVFERLLGQRIVIAPGELFSLEGRYRQYVRLSGTLDGPENLELAIKLLADAVRSEMRG